MALAPHALSTPEPTETAVVVVVPEAEPVVSPQRERYDIAASWGVPAHITVLFPFVEPKLLSDAVIERLAAAIASVPKFECAFRDTGWFARDVVWLAPDPSEPFQELTRAVVARFPDYLPYGGTYGTEATPHLTVADSRFATDAEMQAADEQVRRGMPISAQITQALLIAGTNRPNSWGIITHLPLR